VMLTYVTIRMGARPRTFKYTFGLKRAEVIAAIINSSTLIIISVFLIKEAIERFNSPEPIAGNVMLIVAIMGLSANTAGTLLLKKGSKENINIRAAYLHLLSDAVSSVAVIIGALSIILFKIYWIDSVLTVCISLYIIKETFDIVKESVDIIMMATPGKIDLNMIKSIVEKIYGVITIHHIHIWKLNDKDLHLEAHIDVDDMPVSETEAIQEHIERELYKNFEINHVTLQFECNRCEEKGIIHK